MIRRVLDTLHRCGKFVLNGTDRPFGTIAAKEKVMPAIRPWALHDLRRSFASGLQRLGLAIWQGRYRIRISASGRRDTANPGPTRVLALQIDGEDLNRCSGNGT
jgi:hypothetical protein